jgi:DnaJ-class molecular chaperone
MELTNYYELLKIEKSVDIDTIKKAFRTEIALYHPDNNSSIHARTQFDLLMEGFHILSNPERRNAYDKMLLSSKNNIPVVINEPIEEFQYNEWKQESKKKSQGYWDGSIAELLLTDIFLEVGFNGLVFGADELLDGIGDSLGDIFDIF